MIFEKVVQLYKGQSSYITEICDLKRELPLCKVEEDMWIASNHRLVLGRDMEFTRKVSEELNKFIKDYEPDILFTAEAKSLPLVYKISEILNIEMTVARKGIPKAYMGMNYLSEEIKSITTKESQRLILESDQAERINGKRVALVDDVVSTYGTMGGLERLVLKAGGKIVCKAAIWLEGPWYKGDLIYLAILPIFVTEKKFNELKKLYG